MTRRIKLSDIALTSVFGSPWVLEPAIDSIDTESWQAESTLASHPIEIAYAGDSSELLSGVAAELETGGEALVCHCVQRQHFEDDWYDTLLASTCSLVRLAAYPLEGHSPRIQRDTPRIQRDTDVQADATNHALSLAAVLRRSASNTTRVAFAALERRFSGERCPSLNSAR